MSFLDIRLNPFDLYMIFTHIISFSCTPLDKNRVLEERDRKLAQRSLGLGNPGLQNGRWWLRLARPIEVLGLIKRYHLVGSWFFLAFFGHLLILIHFTIKSAIHTFYTGSDRNRMQYFDTIYYPQMTGVLQDSHLFNNLFLAMSLCHLSLRLLSAYELVRGSIVNEHEYKEISPTQVNLGLLTLCELSIGEWIEMFKKGSRHDEEVRMNPTIREAHFKVDPNIKERLNKLSRKDSMLHVNIIDYNECHDQFDYRNTGTARQSWHYTLPAHHISLVMMRSSFALALIGYVCGLVAGGASIYGWIYIEVGSLQPADGSVSGTELFNAIIRHFSHPSSLIRVVEVSLLVLSVIPAQFDCAMIVVDQIVVISRAHKLTRILEADLALSQAALFASSLQTGKELPTERKPSSAASSLQSRELFQNYNLSYKLRDLNEQIQSHIGLVSVLHSEFLGIKQNHSIRVNMVIIGNGFSLTYLISLLLAVDGLSQRVIVIVGSLSSLIMVIDLLVSSASTERAFKNMYRLMGRFLVNRSGTLSVPTVNMIRKTSEAFEQKKDRSFLIAGLYAITPDSLAPFVAYMATAILFLNRFVLRT